MRFTSTEMSVSLTFASRLASVFNVPSKWTVGRHLKDRGTTLMLHTSTDMCDFVTFASCLAFVSVGLSESTARTANAVKGGYRPYYTAHDVLSQKT